MMLKYKTSREINKPGNETLQQQEVYTLYKLEFDIKKQILYIS